jgi:hypothetical protein
MLSFTSSSPSSTDPIEPVSQQQLLGRLLDSLEAMEEVQNLTRDLGTFVLKSRFQASQKRAARASDSMTRPLKRKRTAEESSESSSDLHQTVSTEPSVRRMLMLYQHLQKTQALFQLEISKFIDETEEEVWGEQQSLVSTPMSAE